MLDGEDESTKGAQEKPRDRPGGPRSPPGPVDGLSPTVSNHIQQPAPNQKQSKAKQQQKQKQKRCKGKVSCGQHIAPHRNRTQCKDKTHIRQSGYKTRQDIDKDNIKALKAKGEMPGS